MPTFSLPQHKEKKKVLRRGRHDFNILSTLPWHTADSWESANVHRWLLRCAWKAMNIKCVFVTSIVLSWQLLGREIAVQQDLMVPAPSCLLGHLPAISALHRTSANLILRTTITLIAPNSENVVWAAKCYLGIANTPQTNAISTLKWAPGYFSIRFIECILLWVGKGICCNVWVSEIDSSSAPALNASEAHISDVIT